MNATTESTQATIERWRKSDLCRLDVPAKAIVRKCPHCDFTGDSRREVFRHAVTTHADSVGLMCPVCYGGAAVTGVESFVDHWREFHPDPWELRDRVTALSRPK